MTVEKLPASTRAAGALGRHGACAPPTSPDCARHAGGAVGAVVGEHRRAPGQGRVRGFVAAACPGNAQARVAGAAPAAEVDAVRQGVLDRRS
ncbi:MAG: hypothetical protein QOE59_2397 [Actinomycetota bacterium]|jgi:hypothetical protein|nr:hypothetical protein [Actinomycetota bacterium]